MIKDKTRQDNLFILRFAKKLHDSGKTNKQTSKKQTKICIYCIYEDE